MMKPNEGELEEDTKQTRARSDGVAGSGSTRVEDSTNATHSGSPQASMKSGNGKKDAALPALGFVGTVRWAWTQLTSMRTALFLLLLLAVAAVPGSLFPQRPANPAVVTQYIKDNPDSGPWLDRLQLFDVYSSVWFSAIYLLLFISLIGCVIPRTRVYYRALRSRPPRTPSRLSRMPEYGTLALPAATPDRAGTDEDGGARRRQPGAPASAAAVVEQAAGLLKKRGYRVDARDLSGKRPSVGAERGFLKELGNLVFHTALIGVLISVALGGLFGYRGQKVLVEGDTFVNTLIGYDSFNPGSNFSEDQLDPYSLTLDNFEVEFDRESTSHYGQPLDFTAWMTTRASPDAAAQKQVLKVNDPINIGGTRVYLVGNGYAPVVTVRDGNGDVAFQGPVAAIANDAAYTSLTVLKVPDARPQQLGFVGFFLPTARVDENGVAFASDPDPLNPQLNLNSYYGDLGLDGGEPKNAFTLDTDGLTPLNNRNLDAGGIVLGAYESYDLPDDKGSITFDGLKRYVALDVTYDPAKLSVLIFSTTALLGLMGSLFISRRRVWVRAGEHDDGRIMVEYGLLARGEDHRLGAESAALRQILAKAWLTSDTPDGDNLENNTDKDR